MKKNEKMKHVFYLCLALGTVLYAAPKIFAKPSDSMEMTFSAVWLGFAMLYIAAQLYRIFGVDEETKKELEQVRRMRRWRQWERGR